MMSILSHPPRSLYLYLGVLLFTSRFPSVISEPLSGTTSAPIQDVFTRPPSNICLLAQDGITFANFPWTHNPTCVRASDAEDGTHQDFCVYTNSVFASGRGISIITTPEIATSLAAESFTPYEEELEGPLLYEARETKDRGIGLFAKKNIVAGTSLMIKHPVLFVARDALSATSRQQRQLLLSKAVEQLPVKTQTTFMNLATSRGGPKINDIVQTNSMGMKFEDGTGHLGVVPEASRINHACRSNAFYRFDDWTLRLDVFAWKDIKAGEEITFSYGYSSQPHEVRQQMLKANWGFTCTCPLCTSNSSTIAASDARLNSMVELQQAIPTSQDDLPLLLGLLPNLIELFDEEGLVIDTPGYEEILAYAFSSFSNEKRAREWGERAVKHWEVLAGRNSYEVKRMVDFLADMKIHGSWGTWKEDPWEGVGKGHPWDDHSGHDHDHDHDHHHNHHDHEHNHDHSHHH